MQSKAATVEQYLRELPEDRRRALEALRAVVRKNMDPRLVEGMQYGGIGYFIPHSVYPPGYHCDPKQPLPVLGLASQKNHIGIYMCMLDQHPGEHERFTREWTAAGKRLDMGKGCVRVKRLDEVPLGVLASAVKRTRADAIIATYESHLAARGVKHPGKKGAPGGAARASAKEAAPKKAAPKKAASKKPASKKASSTKAVSKRAASKEAAPNKAAPGKAGAKRRAAGR